MADHQTIGGYANIGQIILVDLPKLAQMKNDIQFHWAAVSVEVAQQSYLEIQNEFHQYDKKH
jgi:allophanate hydrolase subunit 2